MNVLNYYLLHSMINISISFEYSTVIHSKVLFLRMLMKTQFELLGTYNLVRGDIYSAYECSRGRKIIACTL